MAVNESEIEKQALERQSYAQSLTITTPEDYQQAGESLKGVRALFKFISSEWDAVINPIKASLTAAQEKKKKYTAPVAEADALIVKKMGDYDAEIARQAREKAAAEARAAATEKQRLADIEAEKIRVENARLKKIADEKAAELKAAGDKKAAKEAADKAARDDERRKKKAEEEAQAEADRIREQGEIAARVASLNAEIPDSPKVDGISKGRTIWKFRITDPDKIPHAYLIPDETAIGGVVRAMQDKSKAEKAIPGIEVWSETSKVGVKF